MSKVVVNGHQTLNGSFSFSRMLDESVNPPVLHLSGVFTTDEYIDEITSFSNERYDLHDVNVFEEDFGSEDDAIIYHFTFKDFDFKKKVKVNG